MKLPTSMWSGQIVNSAPPSDCCPLTIITLEPTPSTSAPIRVSRRARSWTCGSEAALEIVVWPGVSAAAISAFSVPITEGLVHEDLAGAEAGRRAQLDPARPVDAGAEVGEGVEVGVEAAAADEVAAGRRHLGGAEACQQRPREQERRADLTGELLVDHRSADAGGAELDAVVSDPVDRDPEVLEQGDLRLGVADARHAVQQYLLLGQQAGGEDRQGGILVAGDGQLAGERDAPFDDEFLHGRSSVTTGLGGPPLSTRT